MAGEIEHRPSYVTRTLPAGEGAEHLDELGELALLIGRPDECFIDGAL
jgi:hypothetical protein